MLFYLVTSLAQLLPVRHFAHHAGPFTANHRGRVADVVPQLGVGQKLSGSSREILCMRPPPQREWSQPTAPFGRSQDFGKMKTPHAGVLPAEPATDVHQTGVVARGADFSAGIENAASLV